jgi:hypothetical protein
MTLDAIKSAIEELPEEEKRALADWLLSLDREKWDEEISEGFSAGGHGMKISTRLMPQSIGASSNR